MKVVNELAPAVVAKLNAGLERRSSYQKLRDAGVGPEVPDLEFTGGASATQMFI